ETRPARRLVLGLTVIASVTLVASLCPYVLSVKLSAFDLDPNLQPFADESGEVLTVATSGSIDLTNPFFQSLGRNGRACVTCHQPQDAWSVTPSHLQARFARDGGLDPIFRLHDGATGPGADVSTVGARQQAFKLLLSKGLIRVTMTVPANAEFELAAVDDPYRCRTPEQFSMYRRPLPSTNLRFLSTVMWDGRETVSGQPIANDLITQATDATLGHAEAAVAPSAQQLQQIVTFELGLFT